VTLFSPILVFHHAIERECAVERTGARKGLGETFNIVSVKCILMSMNVMDRS
jgi:hypothetical protein